MRKKQINDQIGSIYTQLSPFPLPKFGSATMLTQSPFKSVNDIMKLIDTPMVNKKINYNTNG
jgi:hypothetical protein